MPEATGATPDQETEEEITAGPNGGPPPPPNGDDPELPAQVKQILSENRKALRDAERRAKQAELKAREFEDRDKTELERATSRAEEASRELAEYKQRAVAQTVAIEAGIPEWWERLKGSDEAALRADAKELAKRVGPQSKIPAPDLGAGPREYTTEPTGTMAFSTRIREQARRQ